MPPLAASSSAACCLLIANECSRRSSNSFISGLFMSRALPLPKMLEAFADSAASVAAAVGTDRGRSKSFGRPSGATSIY